MNITGDPLMGAFQFRTTLEQTVLLGLKAKNAAELLEGIRTVPKSSIYHHTHRFLQQHHYLSPEPSNDFAYWISEVVNDEALGESLSSIDVIQFHTIADLRTRLEEIISSYLGTGDQAVDCPRGEEFHFMASQTFALTTRYAAHNLSEFSDMLRRVSVSSLYYHIFDSKLRLGQDENDFSLWFRTQGKPLLAEEVLRLDPYTHTLEGLRRRILVMVKRYDTD
jgi:hypothetical protein